MTGKTAHQRNNAARNLAILGAAVIVVAALVAYYPAMRAGYVWDDDFYVTKNTLLTAPDGLQRIWFSLDSPSQYFPLVYTTFRVERAIWGLNPMGFHLVNILFHIANALALWLLLARLRVRGAWLAAAIFAVHPVNVESVAWITERKNVLTLFFSLGATLAWLKFTETADRRAYAAAFLLYMLALFSKTTASTLPAAMLLVVWLRDGKILWKRALQVVPFLAWGVVMGLVTVWWERYHQGTQGPEFALTWLGRVLVAGRALWFYVGKLFWPSGLSFSYGKWNVDQSDPAQYLWLIALVLAAVALFVWRRKIGRGPITAVIFFAVTPIPMLGFFSLYTFRYAYVADHYQYVASIGLIALFAAAVARGWTGSPMARKASALIGGVALIALGALTWNQCLAYKDAETLWRDTIRKSPRAAIAHVNLGRILLDRGESEAALHHFGVALEIAPSMPEVHNNLGVALMRKNDLVAAEKRFIKAEECDPKYADAHINLGAVYLKRGDCPKAESELRAALRINPYLTEAHSNLGIALAEQGHLDEAIEHFREALRLNPQDPGLKQNLDHALSLKLGG